MPGGDRGGQIGALGGARGCMKRVQSAPHGPPARPTRRPHAVPLPEARMQIRVGFEMIYDCPQPTPMIFNLNVHFTRVSDLVGRDDLMFDPPVPIAASRNSFGN